MFLAALIFDGVLERFPTAARRHASSKARCGSCRGCRSSTSRSRTFGRTEQVLRNLPLEPSEYVRRQLRFTPFPGEPVGWMIETGGDRAVLLLVRLSAPEGTKDPIGRFEATLTGVDEARLDRFYRANFAELMGDALTR